VTAVDEFGHTEVGLVATIPGGPTERLYDAEDEAFRRSPQVPLLDGTQETAQAFATKVVRSSHWRRHCAPCWIGWVGGVPTKVVVIKTNCGGSTFAATQVRGKLVPELRLGNRPNGPSPEHVRNQWVILHELAHAMVRNSRPAHGREFAVAYLGLVRRFLGADAGKTLLACYREFGVPHVLKRG
jgi:hypothetical protein